MSRLFVNQISENTAVDETYRLLDKMLRPNKQGSLYLQFVLNDRTGSVSARLWNVTKEFADKFADGDFVRCEGVAQRYQGNIQVIARKISKVNPGTIDLSDFSAAPPVDSNALLDRLRELLGGVSNPQLSALIGSFLNDSAFMTRFSRAYAGVRLHHAHPGGLLEHTLAIMELAKRVGEQYSGIVDADLLLVGAFLHDAGKIYELSDDPVMPVYTDAGQALGHLYLGAELVAGKIRETEAATGEAFDPRLSTMLRHMIISHHGSPEFGAVKAPMTREAIALHFLDALDAKLNEFQKYIQEDAGSDKSWTNYIPAIDRKLMK